MKRLIKAAALLLCVTMICALAACAPACTSEQIPFSDGNEFFDAASPETSVLMFYVFDGGEGYRSWISDLETEKAILNELSRVDVRKVPWSPDKAKGKTIYGISIGTGDVLDVKGSWCDGYWIASDSYAYEFDYDFAKLEKNYEWENKQEFTGVEFMPNARWLTENMAEWNKTLMTKSDWHTAPENVSMELLSANRDGAEVKFINSGDEEWIYGEYYSLEVKLKGEWYVVPSMPENWAFNDIAYILNGGAETEKTYNFGMYGDLPAGEYRIVAEELTAKFTLK